jgi:hypothetical protein
VNEGLLREPESYYPKTDQEPVEAQTLTVRARPIPIRDGPGVGQLGSAEYPNIIEEYQVDTGLLKELREHEKQAAQELGQWSDKARVEQGPMQVQVVWSEHDAHR